MLAQNPNYQFEEKLNDIEKAKMLIEEVLATENSFSKKDLAINGNDLIALGYKSGVELGRILNGLYELVLEDPTLNTYETLVERIPTI